MRVESMSQREAARADHEADKADREPEKRVLHLRLRVAERQRLPSDVLADEMSGDGVTPKHTNTQAQDAGRSPRTMILPFDDVKHDLDAYLKFFELVMEGLACRGT